MREMFHTALSSLTQNLKLVNIHVQINAPLEKPIGFD